MNLSFNDLNENQKKATRWKTGALLVLAGPGSGKTGVLALRTMYLINENEDHYILLLTFTNKAAKEMQERVYALLGKKTNRIHVSTFHAFATDLLRQHGSHLGFKPNFELLIWQEDRIEILEKALNKLENSQFKYKKEPEELELILRQLDMLFTDAYWPNNNSQKQTFIMKVFHNYCDELIAKNCIDFKALLYFARILMNYRGIGYITRTIWSHICVDEFQDTNPAQYALLKTLVPKADSNLFVVADEDQLIYQWNGANPEHLNLLREDYDIKTIQLPESFRCPPQIVQIANVLIQNNQERTLNKKSLTSRELNIKENAIRVVSIRGNESNEGFWIAKDIQNRKLDLASCVILGRNQNILKKIHKELKKANIFTHLSRSKSIFETPEFAFIMMLLRLANKQISKHILRQTCLAINELSSQIYIAEKIEEKAIKEEKDFFRTLLTNILEKEKNYKIIYITKIAQETLLNTSNVLKFIDVVVGEFITSIISKTNNLLREEQNTWLELHATIQNENENINLHSYLQQMNLQSKSSIPPTNALQCFTIHKAKGLEFSHIYLVGMVEGVCPSYHAVKNENLKKLMEEERRVCFVAITRAKKTLTLTFADKYYGWPKSVSRFIKEMNLFDSSVIRIES